MAKLNMVQAINLGLKQEMAKDDSVVILGEDVGRDGGVFRVSDGLIDIYLCRASVGSSNQLPQVGSNMLPDVLLKNDLINTGKFIDVSNQSGPGLQVKLSSRGAAFDDFDNDGTGNWMEILAGSDPLLDEGN